MTEGRSSGTGAPADASAYLVREPRPEDVEGFAGLHVRVWRETYRGVMDDETVEALSVDDFRPQWYVLTRAYAEGTIPGDGRAVRVALLGDEPAGFLMVGPARDQDAPAPWQVYSLNVAPEHQGSGIAQRLMDEVLRPGPAYLWVAGANARAIRFFERNGFVLDGTQTVGQHEGMVEARMVRPA